MSDTESHQASIGASEASIPAENGPREVANGPTSPAWWNGSVLLSTACPTSLASEPNIRGGRSGVQTAPACGAAFGGIDNDQPEIKARQRHRARLDPKPRYPSKDFHHKEFAKKLRDGFRGLREKRKELNHNFKGNTEGNSYVSRRPLLQAQRTRCAHFFL